MTQKVSSISDTDTYVENFLHSKIARLEGSIYS